MLTPLVIIFFFFQKHEGDTLFSMFRDKKEYLERISTLTEELKVLQAENKNLHEQATKLHEKHHRTTLQVLLSGKLLNCGAIIVTGL